MAVRETVLIQSLSLLTSPDWIGLGSEDTRTPITYPSTSLTYRFRRLHRVALPCDPLLPASQLISWIKAAVSMT